MKTTIFLLIDLQAWRTTWSARRIILHGKNQIFSSNAWYVVEMVFVLSMAGLIALHLYCIFMLVGIKPIILKSTSWIPWFMYVLKVFWLHMNINESEHTMCRRWVVYCSETFFTNRRTDLLPLSLNNCHFRLSKNNFN